MLWRPKFRLSGLVFAVLAALLVSAGRGFAQQVDQTLLREAGAFLSESRKPGAFVDDELGRRLVEYSKTPSEAHRKSLNEWLDTRREFGQTSRPTVPQNATAEVKAIKSNPLFRDAGDAQDANWIQSVFDRLGRLQQPKIDTPNANLPGFLLPGFITPLMWGLLAALVAFFGYHAFKHVQLKQRIKRKSASLLEDSEPERTQSEWRMMAEKHEAAGEYRLAVRCLYIAMLLTFDEFRVARFDRRQTNWEHLARIEGSAAYPSDVGFRHLTQRFDRIWYGNQTKGAPDVSEFRSGLDRITGRLKVKPE